MNIHEYQAKELFKEYGIPITPGLVASSAGEAAAAARELGGEVWVVKAQAHAGGRGKAGGVKLARSAEQAAELAAEMLSKRLVTHQSGPQGSPVDKVLVGAGVNIQKEYYIALAVDSANAGATFIASAEGGTEIEEVSRENPEAIIRQPVDFNMGVRPYMCVNMAKRLGLPKEGWDELQKIMRGMFRLLTEKDCSMVEINPLAQTPEGLAAIDAKVNFDDNALFRHPEIREMRDMAQEDSREAEAAEFDLSYVGMDGNIGCMVNGAGLAMATMDMLQHYGGAPANFLDVGGSATEERVAGAFRILLSDAQVKAIFVNIFGGIMRCDVIASGIVKAAKKIGISIPLVVRLEGTNAELGEEILAESGLDITPAGSFEEGGRLAVQAAGA
jgi:succinyl-CoA synthetase beta subunit